MFLAEYNITIFYSKKQFVLHKIYTILCSTELLLSKI